MPFVYIAESRVRLRWLRSWDREVERIGIDPAFKKAGKVVWSLAVSRSSLPSAFAPGLVKKRFQELQKRKNPAFVESERRRRLAEQYKNRIVKTSGAKDKARRDRLLKKVGGLYSMIPTGQGSGFESAI